MKKLVFIVFVLSILSSCETYDYSCTCIHRSISLKLKDTQGNNLINSSNFDHIQIYYLIGGELKNGETPKFINEQNILGVTIFLNNNPSEEFPITYVKWNNLDTDTIKAKYINNNRSLIKLWINDIEVKNSDYDENGMYTLIK